MSALGFPRYIRTAFLDSQSGLVFEINRLKEGTKPALVLEVEPDLIIQAFSCSGGFQPILSSEVA